MKVQGYAAQQARTPLTPYSFDRREPRDHDVVIDIQYCGTMACRNLCERLYPPTKVRGSYYADGKKYCRRCEIYLHHSGVFCPCCGMALRRDKEKLRLVRNMNM